MSKVYHLHDNIITALGEEFDHIGETQFRKSREGVMVIEEDGFKHWFGNDDPFFGDLDDLLSA